MLQYRKVVISDVAQKAVKMALNEGEITRGPYIEMVEDRMKDITGCEYAVAVSSGTMALTLAMEAMVGKFEDENERAPTVAVPDLGFVVDGSVPHSLQLPIVYTDIEMKSWVMSDKYAAIMSDIAIAIHLGGVMAPKLKKPTVYDSAHRIGKCPGVTSIFSFHPSKIISGAEGGCVTTDDKGIADYVRAMRMFGFVDGKRYIEHGMWGYKGMMTNLSAILIFYGLEQLEWILDMRAWVRDLYNERLGLKNEGLGMYMVPVANPNDPTLLGNGFIWHYPRTLSEQFEEDATPLMNAYWATRHLISAPFHEFMTEAEIDEAVELLQGKVIQL